MNLCLAAPGRQSESLIMLKRREGERWEGPNRPTDRPMLRVPIIPKFGQNRWIISETRRRRAEDVTSLGETYERRRR